MPPLDVVIKCILTEYHCCHEWLVMVVMSLVLLFSSVVVIVGKGKGAYT